MNRWMTIVLLSMLEIQSDGEMRISLNSNDSNQIWMVSNGNKSIHIEAKVPGGIYTDLLSAKILEQDLFYRFNDIEYRWVSRDNWTYRTEFNLSLDVLDKKVINLIFHGIDTVGNIYLNGKFLTFVDNMFVRHVVPVRGTVKEKSNSLEIRFESPVREADRLSKIQKKSYPIPPECSPDAYHGECHVNFLRKMQASFSWDWGPAFPSVGIWKSVEVEAYDMGVIRDVTVTSAILNSRYWLVKANYYVELAAGEDHLPATRGHVTSFEGTRIEAVPGRENPGVEGCSGLATFILPREDFAPWWPNGFGNATLHDLTLEMENVDGSESTSKTIKIGLRTIELVQERIRFGSPGLSFYLRINGIPIFAKGSNWIPGHILPELGQSEARIRRLLRAAKDANMNMLRVWGGGVYESDLFYQIADELGILIWQDMMFACAMYPANPDFLGSVKTETVQQVRRIQHHASVALWACNNENEAALRGNWYGTRANFSLYKRDYVKLYVETIQSAVLENDPSRTCLISSPSNGMETVREDYIARDPYSPLYGDVHYYNYVFDGWTDYLYPDARFASEYGFQSMPSFRSMSNVSLASDRNLESDFTRWRQHLPGGNDFLAHLISHQFSLPANDASEEYYKTFIYHSQITQAMSTKTETEKYRRDRSKLTPDNKGMTMGAMYWQLNDVWQAPSWSSIEFDGKWKMLHYYAKKFFSPVLVSPERTPNGRINVFLISDLLEDVTPAFLSAFVYSWDSFSPKKFLSSRVTLKNNSAEIHASYRLEEFLEGAGCDSTTCFLYFRIEGPNVFSENFLFPSKMKEVKNLKRPNLKVEVSEGGNPFEAIVKVTTDRIAPFVWLETEETGEFSDNGFTLAKENVTLVFANPFKDPIDLEKFKSTLEIRSVH